MQQGQEPRGRGVKDQVWPERRELVVGGGVWMGEQVRVQGPAMCGEQRSKDRGGGRPRERYVCLRLDPARGTGAAVEDVDL